MTTILGIDPGTNITGFGVIKLSKNADISYVHHEIIKTGGITTYNVNTIIYTSI